MYSPMLLASASAAAFFSISSFSFALTSSCLDDAVSAGQSYSPVRLASNCWKAAKFLCMGGGLRACRLLTSTAFLGCQ